MTTDTTIATNAPTFAGLPRRRLGWSLATLAVWVLLCAGFVGSLASLPEPEAGSALTAAQGAVAEVPCPPACAPAHG